MNRDLLDWLRAEFAASPPAVWAAVEPVLQRARQTWGGDTVYVRLPEPRVCGASDSRIQTRNVTRRTLQRQRNRTP